MSLPICTCGHMKSWHPKYKGKSPCRFIECPCEDYKPNIEPEKELPIFEGYENKNMESEISNDKKTIM